MNVPYGWRVIIDPSRSATEHMAHDEAFALEGVPMLRLFRWDPPAISLGWKQPYPEWLDAAQWCGAGLELTERPTGGGIAFHGSDLSLSVVLPRALDLSLALMMRLVCEQAVRLCATYGVDATTLESIPTLHERVLPPAPRTLCFAKRSSRGSGVTRPRVLGWALRDAPPRERLTYCLTQPSPYAVMIGSKKVAGFALRRYPESWLIQGSLLVGPMPFALRQRLPTEVTDDLDARAISLAEAATMSVSAEDVAGRWAERWSLWWDDMVGHELAVCV